MNNFESLSLDGEFIKVLDQLGYKKPTDIQKEALPYLLKGKDLIAQAKTGSGKTVAFGIPLLLKLDLKRFHPQAIVLTPTRELADQVAKELRKLARFKHNIKILTLAGGMPMRHQINSLSHGANVIVGTPGRIQDHLSKQTLKLDFIKTVVLDEADRMLDMGFYESIEKILSNAPKKRQTMLFSATFPENIEILSKTFMNNPQHVKVEALHDKAIISQIFYEVDYRKKLDALIKLLQHYKPNSVLIFCNTKVDVTEVTRNLQDDGFDALDLHGDLEQVDRNETLLQFENRSCAILVATDVAARGLDIKGVDMVINYDLPRESENYIHRIGRTGRAGEEGVALSLISDREYDKVAKLQENPNWQSLDKLKDEKDVVIKAPMATLCIHGGKKNKLRAGDILGALTGDIGLDAKVIGKINIFDFFAYVAIERKSFNRALEGLDRGKIKKRSFRVWRV